MDFLTQKFMDCTLDYHFYGLHPWLPFLCGLWYGSLIHGVCVRDLKLVRYHNKETKGLKKN